MADTPVPDGFAPAGFSPGFLDHGGPYYLRPTNGGPKLVGLRICRHHINYKDAAHGGVISTFAGR